MRGSILLLCFVLSVFGLIYYFSPLMQPLPLLTGPYNVGTKTYYWTDTNRYEKYAHNPNTYRTLRIQCWYPTNSDQTQLYPYMADAMPYLIEEFKQMYAFVPSKLWPHLFNFKTPAIPDAPLKPSEKEYPVIVFSHGFEGIGELYSAILLQLASHGYIVIGIDHTYLARIVPMPNGNAIDIKQHLLETVMCNRDNRKFIDQTMAQDFKTCIPDILFVFDQLQIVNGDSESFFYHKLDFNRLGVMGHSMGGIASLEACRIDDRCKAVLVMDYFNIFVNSIEPINKSVMFMIGQEGIMTKDDPWIQEQYTLMNDFCSSSAPYCSIIMVPKAGHIAFCDLILLKWPANRLLSWWGLPIGHGNANNTLTFINQHIEQFFDRALQK